VVVVPRRDPADHKDCAPNVYHRFSGNHALGGERHDREAFGRWLARLERFGPDMKLTVRDVWVKGLPHNTTIIVRWTNTDALPDGSRYENHGVYIVKMRWGKIVEIDANEDSQAVAEYGGYFLLTSLMDKTSGYMDNPLRHNFFRAGHAHAGVIVILSLVCQILADSALLPAPLVWFVRIGVPLSAIFISAGFFFSMLPPTATQPTGAVSLIYVGAVILAASVITLAVGLIRTPA
jgi:ketosteroid isomerase-like protein